MKIHDWCCNSILYGKTSIFFLRNFIIKCVVCFICKWHGPNGCFTGTELISSYVHMQYDFKSSLGLLGIVHFGSHHITSFYLRTMLISNSPPPSSNTVTSAMFKFDDVILKFIPK